MDIFIGEKDNYKNIIMIYSINIRAYVMSLFSRYISYKRSRNNYFTVPRILLALIFYMEMFFINYI